MQENKFIKPAGKAGKAGGKGILDALKKVTKKQWIIGGAIGVVGIGAPVIGVSVAASNKVDDNIVNLDSLLSKSNDFNKINEDILSGKYAGFKYRGKTYKMSDEDEIYAVLKKYFDESRIRYPEVYDAAIGSTIVSIGGWESIEGKTIPGSAIGESYVLPSDFPEAPKNTYYEFSLPSTTGEEHWARNLSSWTRYPTPWIRDVDTNDSKVTVKARLVAVQPLEFYQDSEIEFTFTIDNSKHPRVEAKDVSSEFDFDKHVVLESGLAYKNDRLLNVASYFTKEGMDFRDKYVQSFSPNPSYEVQPGTLITFTMLLKEGYSINGSNVWEKQLYAFPDKLDESRTFSQAEILGANGEKLESALKYFDDGTGTGTIKLTNEFVTNPLLSVFKYAVTTGSTPESTDWAETLPTGIDYSSTSNQVVWVMLEDFQPALTITDQKTFSYPAKDIKPEITDVNIPEFFGTDAKNYTEVLRYHSVDFNNLSAGYDLVDGLEIDPHIGTFYEYALTTGDTDAVEADFSTNIPTITGVDGENLWVRLSLIENTKTLYNIVGGDSQPAKIPTDSLVDSSKFMLDGSQLYKEDLGEIAFEGRWIEGSARDDFDKGFVQGKYTLITDLPGSAVATSFANIPAGYELQWQSFWWGGASSWGNVDNANSPEQVKGGELTFAAASNGTNLYTGYRWKLTPIDSTTHDVYWLDEAGKNLFANYVNPASYDTWDAFVLAQVENNPTVTP